MKFLSIAVALAISCSSAFASSESNWQEPCKLGASHEPIKSSIGARLITLLHEAGLFSNKVSMPSPDGVMPSTPTSCSMVVVTGEQNIFIHLPEGRVAEFCPDFKGKVWPLKNGLAVPFSKDGRVTGEAFLADGTPLTPTSCMAVVGSGSEQRFSIYWRISAPEDFQGEINVNIAPTFIYDNLN